MLNAAKELRDLKSPGNQVERLKKDRAGQHSIRISGRWRICFVWDNRDARNAEIVDYH